MSDNARFPVRNRTRHGRHGSLSNPVPGSVVVGVPVRNEAALLPRFLRAIAEQRDAPDLILCIAFDGCDDDSAAIVEAARADLPFEIRTVTLERAEPNAGRARRYAMELALTNAADDDTILLSTDADTLPAEDWLAANVAALAEADVVTGQILRDPAVPSTAQDRVEAYYDGLFRLRRVIDPVPWEAPRTHHYTSAASLALRAGVYRALGGFDAIPSAEDARLIDRAYLAGLRVRRDADVRVTTSSRRHGRARDGLADHLRRLDEAGAGVGGGAMMAHPEDVVWRYVGHSTAREGWYDPETHGPELARQLGCALADMIQIGLDAPNAEAFANRIVPEIPGGERLVTIDVAEASLDVLEDVWGPTA